MAGKTVLILGGRTGGVVAANELRKLLSPEHRIVLIEKEGRYAFAPFFLARRFDSGAPLRGAGAFHADVEHIRVWIALEDVEDLWSDLAQALA